MNPKADFFFIKAGRWQEELEHLRNIALNSGLSEEVKWGCPCYTDEGSNIVLIHTFKEYCALLFFKGALMKDPEGILIRQTANVQAARQLRFTGAAEIGVHKAGGLAKDGPVDPLPANVLGSQSVAPLTMANAFATFAANGVYCQPVAILKATDSNGEELKVPSANCSQKIDEGVAKAMNYALSNVWNGTAKGIARPGFAAIPAVRDGRIHEIKAPLILQPGPAALTDGFAAIRACLG